MILVVIAVAVTSLIGGAGAANAAGGDNAVLTNGAGMLYRNLTTLEDAWNKLYCRGSSVGDPCYDSWTWYQPNPSVEAVASSTRVAYRDACGRSYSMRFTQNQYDEGRLLDPFSPQNACGDTRAVAVATKRFGIINGCGAVYMKEASTYNGPLGGWFQQTGCDNVKAISLAGDRLGMIDACGAAWVKDGPMGGPWQQQTTCNDTKAIAVAPNRLGIINGCGAAYAKYALTSGWTQLTGCNDAKAIAISPTHIAIINGCGGAYAKETYYTDPWVQLTGCNGTRTISVSRNRVAIVDSCGSAWAKEGPITQPWVQMTPCNGANGLIATKFASDGSDDSSVGYVPTP